MKFCQKLPLFCRENEMLARIIPILLLKWNVVGNKPSFPLNWVTIYVLQIPHFCRQFRDANPWFQERLELFPGLEICMKHIHYTQS